MKTIKQSLAIILAIFSIIFLSGQTALAQDQFKLSDYKNPDYRWHQLDVGFGLAGNNNFDRQKVENGVNKQQVNSGINNNLQADYNGTKNSSSYQGFQDFGLSTSFGSSRLNYEDLDDPGQQNKEIIRRGELSLSFNTVNRFYNQKKMFLEADLSGYGSFGRTSQNYSAQEEALPYNYKNTDEQYELYASVPLKAGFGRIEEVQNARLAIYILDDLRASGDIKIAPIDGETQAFADFITQLKNQRYFDSRLRKIAEITSIDSFLTVRGLKAESDASYYTLINDDWDFANGPVRSAGGKFSVGVTPTFGYSFHENEYFQRDTLFDPDIIENTSNLNNSRSDRWAIDFNTGYIFEMPSSLYWQHTFVTSLSYELYRNTYKSKEFDYDTLTTESSLETDSPRLKFGIGYKLGYYPNSRTQISLGINSNYVQQWGTQIQNENDENSNDIGQILVSNNIQLNCYYYISPQLRFTLDITSAYNFTKDNQSQPEDVTGDRFEHQFVNRINAKLTYSIF